MCAQLVIRDHPILHVTDTTIFSQMQPPTADTWDVVVPTSFQNTIYLPSLKIAITAGSFILYHVGGDESLMAPQVGRILDVTSAIPVEGNNYPLIGASSPAPDINSPVQFAKVNVFQDCLLVPHLNFPADDNFCNSDGWQQVVQLYEVIWVPSHLIVGLSFVFLEDYFFSHSFVDCHGMTNLFVLKYRTGRDGIVSTVPQDACPPFASCIDSFSNLWSVCYCELIFNSIQQIRQEMQRILCRVAQSQGDFTVKNAKLQFPSCSWFYIKSRMEANGIQGIFTVTYTQPKSSLTWGLAYESRPHSGRLEVLRLDTNEKLGAFRALLGKTAGYGVRKSKPKYSDGKTLLNLNDVINVVLCPSSQRDDGSFDETSNGFRRFGVKDDGIDLAYDVSEGMLQIVIRYRKMIITSESLECIDDIGITLQGSQTTPVEPSILLRISPGMEFVDSSYVMRVSEVSSLYIRAVKMYKVDGGSAPRRVDGLPEVVTYADIGNVYSRIQQMLA